MLVWPQTVVEMRKRVRSPRWRIRRRPRPDDSPICIWGLYAEALGDREQAVEHIRASAAAEYAQVGGFMHTVAEVHLSLHPLGP